MKKILITGYSGFVGTHLLNELSGHFDISLLGRSSPNFDYKHMKASIDESTNYSSILDGIDVVIHVAALARVVCENSNNSLDDFIAVNVKGTINLAKQAAEQGIKRFIFISSIKVNGEKTSMNKPFTQADERRPVVDYGISKSEAEQKLERLSMLTEMEYVFIRPPLIYGQGVKGNFSALMMLVSKNLPLPFSAIKKNSRSLVSVYNLVDLIRICIEHPNASNQTFLVSDGNDLSTYAMVKLISEVQNVKPQFFYVPVWMFKFLGKITDKTHIFSRVIDSLEVDISHTKDKLGWNPPYSVKEGFERCVVNKR